MKLLFSILLISTVLCNELVHVVEVGVVDSSHLDTSFEGEAEKEISENLEDVIKIKFHFSSFDLIDNPVKCNDLLSNWVMSSPYLEIHSPPPEYF